MEIHRGDEAMRKARKRWSHGWRRARATVRSYAYLDPELNPYPVPRRDDVELSNYIAVGEFLGAYHNEKTGEVSGGLFNIGRERAGDRWQMWNVPIHRDLLRADIIGRFFLRSVKYTAIRSHLIEWALRMIECQTGWTMPRDDDAIYEDELLVTSSVIGDRFRIAEANFCLHPERYPVAVADNKLFTMGRLMLRRHEIRRQPRDLAKFLDWRPENPTDAK